MCAKSIVTAESHLYCNFLSIWSTFCANYFAVSSCWAQSNINNSCKLAPFSLRWSVHGSMYTFLATNFRILKVAIYLHFHVFTLASNKNEKKKRTTECYVPMSSLQENIVTGLKILQQDLLKSVFFQEVKST